MSRDDRYRQATQDQREFIKELLIDTTEIGVQELGCSGISFVTSAIGYWASELNEVDPKAAAEFFRAVADQVEVGGVVGDSGERRKKAVTTLFEKAASLTPPEEG